MGVVIEQLRAETGEPRRAINLGETGAKVGDAVERQLPLVEQITEVLGPPRSSPPASEPMTSCSP
ncbi:MAG: hypothetical protein GY698_06365 [Actinomycetia bacterium]|nr:hypothetical protein [Actinomycetes bacterium]